MTEFSEPAAVQDLTSTTAELRRTLGRLEVQIQQTRSALIGSATWVFGLLLAASIVTPLMMVLPHADEDPQSYGILHIIGAALAAKKDSGGSDPIGLFLGLCYLLLLVVVLVALHRLRVIGHRRATASGFTSFIAVLLLCGTAGAWGVVLLTVKNSWWQVEPGIILLTVGAVGFAVLALWSKARDWWFVPPSKAPAPLSFRNLDL
ncbi:hypothetical protein SAMN04515671_1747 [Nakamurella panacisegetis]|uniref:Uncharacterized protein n=1 Tax=Nakamurella panacisegetis TaxID=1090615 RepID=A0A1H0LPV2_9ACTN|nr:hypothetical protein [Nakamurella panacisegetis]SDO70083.1 hypothetical protein SAMN04515671_1747 [Nakamurella panacisegetis]